MIVHDLIAVTVQEHIIILLAFIIADIVDGCCACASVLNAGR